MRALLQDNDHRCALGTAARKRAEEAFDVRVAASQLIGIYESVI
jgi:hypothetical protein